MSTKPMKKVGPKRKLTEQECGLVSSVCLPLFSDQLVAGLNDLVPSFGEVQMYRLIISLIHLDQTASFVKN